MKILSHLSFHAAPALLLIMSLSPLGLTGCSDEPNADNADNANADADTDANADSNGDGPFEIEDPYDLVPFQPGVDRENGYTGLESSRPAEGETFAGRIESEDTGFTGIWSHCRPGDFLLSNRDIVVCIQNETTNRYETFSGGKLVDARRHDQPPHEDVFDMSMPLVDFGLATGDHVEVVRDGTDGVAVVRVTGTDIELAHLAGLVGMRLGARRNLEIITEYRLYPDTPSLEMVTQIKAPAGRSFLNLNIGDWFAYGDRARAWTPGSGYGVANRAMPWVAGFGDGTSYGLVFEDPATPMGLVASQGIPYAEMRVAQVSGDDTVPAVFRRWFVVGDGSIDSVRLEAAQLLGEEIDGQEIRLLLEDSSGNPVANAEVLVRNDDGPITWNSSDDQGLATVHLPPGDYQAEITGFAGPLTADYNFTVDDAPAPITLTLPDTGRIDLSIRESDTDTPITSRVRFKHPEYGVWYEYAVLGELNTSVPTGELGLVITRGLEYDLFTDSITVTAGDTTTLSAELVRSVDTSGWRSGDFHQHLEASIDSPTNVYDRILENASQGVELIVPTDHEVISNLNPYIEVLGLGDELSSFPGVEISPVYAHFNIYPAPFNPNLRGRGSIPLADRQDGEVEIRRIPEIIEIARSWPTNPIVQMNHPRSSSGMLEHVGFDPELGPDAVTHTDFTIDINAIEVVNRYSEVCKVFADWAGLLNFGKTITALGNSDSHDANGDAGLPRNYFVTDLAPGNLDPNTVKQALLNQQVTIGSQAFIDFGDDMLPGDTIEVSNGPAEFHVRVQTPDWAEATRLFVIVNGAVVQEIDRTSEAGARFDFDELIQLEVTEDSWVVFLADGPRPTGPLPKTDKVLALTNPVYLNVDGGAWEPPGVRPLNLDAINTGYCAD